MKSSTVLCGILVLCLAGLASASDPDPDHYKVGFELAAYQLRSTLIGQEEGTELRTKVFQYIQNSKTGTKYFLHLLVMLHEILNEPEVKEILDFLESNGVDVNKLFSVKVPPQLYDSLKGEKGIEEEEDGLKAEEDERVLKTLLDGSKLREIVDVEKLLKVSLSLLNENESVRKVYEMLSGPGVKDAVLRVALKTEFTIVLKEVAEILDDSGVPAAGIIYGLMKAFNVKGDKRKMEPADRIVEGLKAAADCDLSKPGKFCAALNKYKKGRKVEL